MIIFYRIHKLKQTKISNINLNSVTLSLIERYNLNEALVIINTKKQFAFCFGFFHPKIYLSTALINTLNIKELEVILIHEKHHLEHNDSLSMFIVSILQMMFPFFPIINDLLNNYKTSCEIHADNEVIKKLKTKKYIISVLKKMLQTPTFVSFATAGIADNTLRSRIECILYNQNYKNKFNIVNLSISAVVLSFFIVIIITPVKAFELKIPSQNIKPVCVSGSNCKIWCARINEAVQQSTINTSFLDLNKTSH